MADTFHYRANCHCGRYRYELTLPEPIKTATACMCSLCVKNGYLWLSTSEQSLKVVRDDGELTEYSSEALRNKVRIDSDCEYRVVMACYDGRLMH